MIFAQIVNPGGLILLTALYVAGAILLVFFLTWIARHLGASWKISSAVFLMSSILVSVSVWKPWLMEKITNQYLDHLCKKEGGEFVYKTVEGVDGFYQMPPEEFSERMGQNKNNRGENFLFSSWNWQWPAFYFVPIYYQYFEVPMPRVTEPNSFEGKDKKFIRYFAAPNQDREPLAMGTDQLQSQFALMQRSITRHFGNWIKVEGGEAIILDLESNEVLAIRRTFSSSTYSGCFQSWGENSDHENFDFVKRVLRPNKR